MESNNKIFTETIGTSSIAKTMRNSLVPTESTKRNIEKNGIIIDDQLRAEKRQQLKEIMDEYYRTYIDNKLSNVALTRTIDWKELFQAIEDNYKQNTTKTKNELEKKQKEKRTEIYKILSDDEKFKQLFNAKLLTNVLPEFIKNQNIDNEENKRKYLQWSFSKGLHLRLLISLKIERMCFRRMKYLRLYAIEWFRKMRGFFIRIYLHLKK